MEKVYTNKEEEWRDRVKTREDARNFYYKHYPEYPHPVVEGILDFMQDVLCKKASPESIAKFMGQ